jgi:carboxypeptidase D
MVIPDPTVLEALHAPTNQFWTTMQNFPWNNNDSVSVTDPSQESMNFFQTLAKNMTENDVKFIMYVGNDDMLGAHFAVQCE